ncbi:MAG: hypothetical protein GY830_10600 [Bacteroidetes bacterium]|nr:hypothetical protein [Bacteroidota bacterium]
MYQPIIPMGTIFTPLEITKNNYFKKYDTLEAGIDPILLKKPSLYERYFNSRLALSNNHRAMSQARLNRKYASKETWYEFFRKITTNTAYFSKVGAQYLTKTVKFSDYSEECLKFSINNIVSVCKQTKL